MRLVRQLSISILFGLFLFPSLSPAEAPPLQDPPAVSIWKTLGKSSQSQSIEIAGFITANEFNESEISEFLLARYPGGCIHVPLPPPSSMIHVTMEKGKTTPIFFGKRVVVRGTLQNGGRIDASFEMTASSVKEYPW
jgi:hypothetical protein